MLRELVINNFALIDRLELSFGPGLTCLTGETGAGKSIVVDALSLVLGGRSSSESLRPGLKTTVEAAFDISGMPGLFARLQEMGLDDGPELVLRREVSPSGRGRAFVNGSMVNLSALQETGEHLVDIHGQHEHQSLLKVDSHLDLLDSFCAVSSGREVYRAAYERLASLIKRRAELSGRERERAQRLDLVRFQVTEIDDAGLAPEEEDALKCERALLVNADRLGTYAGEALGVLRDGDQCALTGISSALGAAREIASLVKDFAETARLLDEAEVSVREACLRLREFLDRLESDPERLSAVEERLELISRLKKKYGPTVQDVLLHRERAGLELEELEGGEEEFAGLDAKIDAARSEVMSLGSALSAARKKGAAELGRRVEGELMLLGMQKARFVADVEGQAEPGPRGLDSVEFLFSANQGEAARPLAKVASGGELSRVMLALKVILAGADSVPTLVFDEVDSGVGGRAADAVGRKLKEASAGRQVLCITHLPQIASLASEHFAVEKVVHDGATAITLKKLGRDERVGEVARMLGGREGSKTASAHAEELVNQGESIGKD